MIRTRSLLSPRSPRSPPQPGRSPGRRAGPHTDPSIQRHATTVLIAERKAAACADKDCASKPLKRAYAGAAPLGW